LIFSISILFEEHESKEQFVNTFGASFGPFISASFTIKE